MKTSFSVPLPCIRCGGKTETDGNGYHYKLCAECKEATGDNFEDKINYKQLFSDIVHGIINRLDPDR